MNVSHILVSILYIIVYLLALLPLSVLYAFSSFLYLIVYYIVRYRRKVVRKNLINSYPEKSTKEIISLEKRFYLHFCDLFVETFKLTNISPTTMLKHFEFKNIQVLDELYENNQSMVLYLGHYGNWEWTTFARAAQPKEHHHEYKSYSVYHPLNSVAFDEFMLKLRSKSGSVLIPQKKVLRTILELKRSNTPAFFCFIADQNPKKGSEAFWMEWLNQTTAPIVGPEKIARQTGYTAVYLDIQKTKRGHYTGEFIIMSEDVASLPENELSKQYMRLMEETINRDPAYWLWSHRRWKRQPKKEV
ncbi:KDO2-lipid IV(A) lauroyltransferase [Dysgonomonadaceae bacterium PH5-43]|nr:KDO2-lipid IV(A) lauroyltransferase [Dysgonomonadaceae bacterium PH5-43]